MISVVSRHYLAVGSVLAGALIVTAMTGHELTRYRPSVALALNANNTATKPSSQLRETEAPSNPAQRADYFAERDPMSWQTYLLVLQLPIVAFLGICTLQVARAFQQRGFIFVALGWLTNLIYLATSHLAALVPPPSLIPHPQLLTHVADVFNVLTAICFWVAYEAARPPRTSQTRRVFIAIGFVALLVYTVFIYRILLPKIGVFAAVPRVLGSAYGIGALIFFYMILRPTEPSRQRYLLRLGLWVYFLIQPLYLLGFFWPPAMDWGFTGGLLAKVCIAFGVIGYLVSAAADGVRAEEQRAHIEDLTGTVGRILHEIATPVSQIGVHSTRLVEVAPRGAFHSHLQSLENARLRLAATLEAARRLLPYPDTLINLRDVTTTFQGIPNFGEEQVISANTVVQLALMAVKETRAEHVRVYTNYARDCCLRCAPIDITQVVINLLRNAYDAMPDGTGVVRLETHTIDNAKGSAIQIVVQDDGEGIPRERQAEIFIQGETTRGGIGRGYGLAVVQDLTAKNRGTVTVKSPATTSPMRPGTMMTLIFPRVPCRRGPV
jgi:signal transduction histidine kinase